MFDFACGLSAIQLNSSSKLVCRNAPRHRMQEAFETLNDPTKRREYDSTDVFDDSLPESCRPDDFFVVFGAAFRRQSRWSERKPVPDLGTADTDFAELQTFYDFWHSFKSWREFPHEDEEDPEVRAITLLFHIFKVAFLGVSAARCAVLCCTVQPLAAAHARNAYCNS
jgi:hypothetical protein